MLRKIFAFILVIFGTSLGAQNANALLINPTATTVNVGQLVGFDLFGEVNALAYFASSFSYTSNLTLLSPLNSTCEPGGALYCGPNTAIPFAAATDAWTANSLVFSSNATFSASNAFIARLLFQANAPGLAQIAMNVDMYTYDGGYKLTSSVRNLRSPVIAVPEPAAILLFAGGLGLLGLTVRRRRRRE